MLYSASLCIGHLEGICIIWSDQRYHDHEQLLVAMFANDIPSVNGKTDLGLAYDQ